MQGPIHTAVVRFRASDTLIADARRRASADGMTLSEFLRSLLRREVKEASPNNVIDVDPLFASAAKGDHAAQRAMVDQSLAHLRAAREKGQAAEIVCAQTLVLARLCASHGDPDDVCRLAAIIALCASILKQAGQSFLADILAAESITLFGRLADTGDEVAAIAVNEIVDMLAEAEPGVIAIAKRMAEREAVQ